jgi:ABC-2 type transport system permease protein
MIVIQEGDPFREEVESMAASLGESLIYKGTTADQGAAMQELRNGNVDMVVVIPPDAVGTIQNNQQVVVQFYHNEIDPYQANYVDYFGNFYVSQLNERVLRAVAEQGQEDASTIEQRLQTARSSTQTMREALERGEAATALETKQSLDTGLDSLSLAVIGSMVMLQGLDQSMDGNPLGAPGDTQAIYSTLASISESRNAIGDLDAGQASFEQEIQDLREMEDNLTSLEAQLADFRSVDPDVLIRPFASEIHSIQEAPLTPINFFAPAVVVLLLQHLAITFSSLSLVRERWSGAMELFRVSPLSAIEILLGKYSSYLLFGSILAAIITVTVIFALKVPMLGEWLGYAAVILVLLFTSLGLGFLISLVSRTDTQAVQYSMFLLLGSVFFSGFFLDLRYLWEPVRVVSWLLPATYAIQLLQGIMLKGSTINPIYFIGLLAMGLAFFIGAWLLLGRQMKQE